MNYFHAVSVYQLINLLLYKKKYYECEENCLILRDLLLPKIRNMRYLSTQFKKIVIYTDYWKGKDVPSQENCIVEYYDELLANEELELENCPIIVGCAHNTFGMYLSIKKINFIFLEDAAGLLSRFEILDTINQGQNTLKYEMICKYGLITGKNPNIKKYICDFKAQKAGFSMEDTEKYIDLCVVQELDKLNHEERTKIIEMFVETKTIPIKENTMILLTQHFANLRTLSFEEQIAIYQIFMDYLTNGYFVIIKPHPDDLMYYPMLFPGISIIREKFPAEFLPFMFDRKPKAVATISSTTSYSLRSCFDNVIEMGTMFEKDYKKVHRYYIALKLLEKLNNKNIVHFWGCNEQILMQLMRSWNLEINLQKYCVDLLEKQAIVIMDASGEEEKKIRGMFMDRLEQESYIVLNSNILFASCNEIEKMRGTIIPIVISKRVLDTDRDFCVLNLEDEVIYFITKNKRFANMVREMRIHMELKACGIEINVEGLNPEQEKIKILEGMLKATEKRLERYIELYGEEVENIDQ